MIKPFLGRCLVTDSDASDFAITDRPIAIVSYAKTQKPQGEEDNRIERPNGRKDYQFIYIKAGVLHVQLNHLWVACGPNTLVVFRPGEPQIYYSDQEIYLKRSYIHFSGSQVEEYLQKYDIIGPIIRFDQPLDVFDSTLSSMRADLFSPYERELCDTLLTLLIIKIGGQLKKENTSKGTRFLSVIQDNYTQNYTIREYANMVGFSEGYFIRFFKRAMNMTPQRYVNTLRIKKAEQLLIYTDKPIGKIATEIGYTDSHYFSRIFKLFNNITPLQYRNLNRES